MPAVTRSVPVAVAMLLTGGVVLVATTQDTPGEPVWVSAMRREKFSGVLPLHKGLEITPQVASNIMLYYLNQPCRLTSPDAKGMHRLLSLQYFVNTNIGEWAASSAEACWLQESASMLREVTSHSGVSRQPLGVLRLYMVRNAVITHDGRIVVTDEEPLQTEEPTGTFPFFPPPTITRWPIP